MKLTHCILQALIALIVISALTGAAVAMPSTQDTRMLSQPAVSARHLAFAYAGDLWVASLDGSNVRRLTSDIGEESSPVFFAGRQADCV